MSAGLPHKFVIAGAGIAGLSAAIALKQAGFQSAVCERDREPREIGAGIQLGPNAVRLLEAWGVSLPPSACRPQAIELRTASSGRLLNAIPLGDHARERYGAPYVTLLRSELHEALLTRARQLDQRIVYDCAVTDIRREGRTMLVEAARETLAAAAVLGADGVHSTVRQWASFTPGPVYAHTTVCRSVMPMSAFPAPFRRQITVWMGSGAHLVIYPVSGDTMLNAVLSVDDNWIAPDFENGNGTELATALQQRLRSWAPAPFAAIAGAGWHPWRLYIVPKSKGGRRRVQLLGDAWHAMPPFLASGGAMAIEDAGALATSMTAKDGHVLAGLDLFREQRSIRVWRVAAQSSRMGRIYHFPHPFDRVRDEVVKSASGPALLARSDWLYGR